MFQLRGEIKDDRNFARLRNYVTQLVALAMTIALLSSCVEAPGSTNVSSMLDVHGTGARLVSELWWLQFWTATAIVLLITVLLGAILWRHRRASSLPAENPSGASSATGIKWIWVGGIALPIIVLLFIFPFTVGNSWALSTPPTDERVTINVIAHRWWWEVQYPDQGFTTANELNIPVGQSVKLNLTSEDVIHSFWVPQLHYKRDLISGQMNTTWLQADEAGSYRGICSEFCGLQHAKMLFRVHAIEPDRFQAWLANEAQDARSPEDELTRRGQEVFLSSTCIYCHTIRGTPAAGETGPDLTHFGNRQTIAAGTLENTVDNLADWITDPQHIKPGSAMPSTPLSEQELQALVAYLRSLK